MHARIVLGVFAFVTFASGLWAAEKEVKVQASRAIKLAIVDADHRAPGRDAFHQTFADTLSFELSQRLNEMMPVKATLPGLDKASWGLGNGIYDVALVVGSTVPRAMVSSDFQILKATPVSGQGKFFLYFVIRREDPDLAKLMGEVFPEALKGQFFLRALARQQGVELEDWRVALAAAK